MKNLCALFIAFMLTGSLYAQKSIGVQAGILSSSVSIKAKDYDEKGSFKMKIGYKAGLFGEIKVSEFLFFRPGLNYVFKGGESSITKRTLVRRKKAPTTSVPDSAVYTPESYNIKFHYIELPLNLVFKKGNEKGKFLAGLGPVLGYGLGGGIHVKSGSSTTKESDMDVKFDNKDSSTDGNYHAKALEIGASAFLGYEFSKGIQLFLEYRPDFTNNSASDAALIKNSYFGLSIAAKL